MKLRYVCFSLFCVAFITFAMINLTYYEHYVLEKNGKQPYMAIIMFSTALFLNDMNQDHEAYILDISTNSKHNNSLFCWQIILLPARHKHY